MRRWKKVGRLRERRRRPKASRIPPGTVPKYRTELARPHCCIRLHASVSDRPFSEPLGKRIFGGRSARLRVSRQFCDFRRSSDWPVIPTHRLHPIVSFWRTVFPRLARSRFTPIKYHATFTLDVSRLHVSKTRDVSKTFVFQLSYL